MGASIDTILQKSDLSSDFEYRSGSCIPIALAIREFFGGELIAISSTGQNIDHLVVKINGKLYDGDGLTSQKELVREFIGPNKNPSLYTRKVDDSEVEHFKNGFVQAAAYEAIHEGKDMIE